MYSDFYPQLTPIFFSPNCQGLREAYDSAREGDDASQPWPAQTVLGVGVPFPTLMESYDSLLMMDDTAVGGVDATTR